MNHMGSGAATCHGPLEKDASAVCTLRNGFCGQTDEPSGCSGEGSLQQTFRGIFWQWLLLYLGFIRVETWG